MDEGPRLRHLGAIHPVIVPDLEPILDLVAQADAGFGEVPEVNEAILPTGGAVEGEGRAVSPFQAVDKAQGGEAVVVLHQAIEGDAVEGQAVGELHDADGGPSVSNGAQAVPHGILIADVGGPGVEGIAQVLLGGAGEAETVVHVGLQVFPFSSPAQAEPVGMAGAKLEGQGAALGHIEVSLIALLERRKPGVGRRPDRHLEVLQFGAGQDGEDEVECRRAGGGDDEVHGFPDGAKRVLPRPVTVALHAEAAVSGLHIDPGGHHGADRANGQGVVRAGNGAEVPIVDEAEVRHVEGFRPVVDQPVRRGFHRFRQGEIQPGKQGDGREDELQVAPVLAEVHRGGEPVGAELVAALGNGREDELPAAVVHGVGRGLELQRVEEPVFDVGKMAPNDAGGLGVIQPGTEAHEPHGGEEEVPDGHGRHDRDEQVEQGCSGGHAKAPHGFEAEDHEPGHRYTGGQNQPAPQHFVAVVLPDEGVQPVLEFLVLSGHSVGLSVARFPPGLAHPEDTAGLTRGFHHMLKRGHKESS